MIGAFEKFGGVLEMIAGALMLSMGQMLVMGAVGVDLMFGMFMWVAGGFLAAHGLERFEKKVDDDDEI